MIGEVHLKIAGIERVVALESDGTWVIEPHVEGIVGKLVGSYLARLIESYEGPSSGPFGVAQLNAVADLFGGKAVIASADPEPSERIY